MAFEPCPGLASCVKRRSQPTWHGYIKHGEVVKRCPGTAALLCTSRFAQRDGRCQARESDPGGRSTDSTCENDPWWHFKSAARRFSQHECFHTAQADRSSSILYHSKADSPATLCTALFRAVDLLQLDTSPACLSTRLRGRGLAFLIATIRLPLCTKCTPRSAIARRALHVSPGLPLDVCAHRFSLFYAVYPPSFSKSVTAWNGIPQTRN